MLEVEIKRTFLGWDRPFLESVVEWLLGRAGQMHTMVLVVPTQEAGRHLRTVMAMKNVGMVPRVVTPQFLLKSLSLSERLQRRAAWQKVLVGAERETLEALLPRHEGQLDSAASRQLATQMLDLEQTLALGGKSFFHVKSLAPALEKERWATLEQLAEAVDRQLFGWKCVVDERSELEKHAQLHPEMQLVVAGVCDLPKAALEQAQAGVRSAVEVLIQAPESAAASMDDWGRPRVGAWQDMKWLGQGRAGAWCWREQVILAETGKLAARRCAELVSDREQSELSFCLADRDMGFAVEREFIAHGWLLRDPDGKKLGGSSILRYMGLLREWLATPAPQREVRTLRAMLLLPESECIIPDDARRHRAMAELDELCMQRLAMRVQTLTLKGKEHLEPVVESLEQWTKKVTVKQALSGLRQWLTSAVAKTSAEVAEKLVEPLGQAFVALENLQKESAADLLTLIIAELEGGKLHQQARGKSLSGWMEMVYEPAKSVHVFGLHEGQVPQSHRDDSFLPDSLRGVLGLETAEQRFVRDCFLWKCLLESRQEVHAYVTKLGSDKEPRMPSRLLLQARGQELAKRVKYLFGEADFYEDNPSAWQRDWVLQLPVMKNPFCEQHKPLSPTALQRYLRCPMHFYLERVLKMERFEPHPVEMDGRHFGNLLHQTMECYGREQQYTDEQDVKVIERVYLELLEAHFFKQYGRGDNLALEIQYGMAQQRLRVLAQRQAEQVAEGWRTVHVELGVGGEDGIPWSYGGHPVRMIIDRIDRHERTGELRVWDYKSSQKKTSPKDAHLGRYKEPMGVPLCGELVTDGKYMKRWVNLQLPMYAAFVKEHFNLNETPCVGYIQLPATHADIGFDLWIDFDDELLESATAAGEEVVQRILNNEFLDVADEVQYSAFGGLGSDGLAAAFGLGAEQ